MVCDVPYSVCDLCEKFIQTIFDCAHRFDLILSYLFFIQIKLLAKVLLNRLTRKSVCYQLHCAAGCRRHTLSVGESVSAVTSDDIRRKTTHQFVCEKRNLSIETPPSKANNEIPEETQSNNRLKFSFTRRTLSLIFWLLYLPPSAFVRLNDNIIDSHL